MGTNYYVHTPGCANACEHCNAGEKLHLGKSSIGWRFCFQAEPEWPRAQAHGLWLERAKSGEIRDEAGETVPLDELLAFIDRKQDACAHTGYRFYFQSSGYDFSDQPFT